MTLYDDIGGADAIGAALDAFYSAVGADSRVSPYFEGVDMVKLKAHVGAFFALALGGPSDYSGLDLRTAHARPRAMGLDDGTVDVFLGHFRAVLESNEVPGDLVDAVMNIANTARAEVLGRDELDASEGVSAQPV
jgi:hemoglobin